MATKKNAEPKIYLIRSNLGGVVVGELVSLDHTARSAVLRNSHRIWRWRGANTAIELATRGADLAYTRVTEATPGEHVIFDVFEAIEVTSAEVAKNLRTPRWPS